MICARKAPRHTPDFFVVFLKRLVSTFYYIYLSGNSRIYSSHEDT